MIFAKTHARFAASPRFGKGGGP